MNTKNSVIVLKN